MDRQAELISKVLVLDNDADCHDTIRGFCERSGLVGLRVQEEHLMTVLRSNVDLGGVMLSESCAGLAQGDGGLARQINQIRPELPLFLRRKREADGVQIAARDARLFAAIYRIDDIDSLQEALDKSIFSLRYPNALVRGIAELSKSVLENQFQDWNVEVETPYLVRDRIIFGELFTLIPLESNWCRGYMMLQAEEESLLRIAPPLGEESSGNGDEDNFRQLNNTLAEITNLIWGWFKNRFIAQNEIQAAGAGHLAQVPIVVNHGRRYISFGSDDAQLCFKYVLSAKEGSDRRPVCLQQRFIFNLSWSPDDFRENQASVEDLCNSGELELF
ncbi:chemotaxis protein CheX [Herbaspirillum lusitanum]|uniref:Chemotaxis protein CheX n=1 Tax=Herbaspirillum lusitanum TaxID=213312 RepID=A0ABW9AG42_9BURK